MRPRGRPRKDSSSLTPVLQPKKDKKQSSDEEVSDFKQKIKESKPPKKEREEEEEEDEEYICPQCEKPDDGTPMIQCDKCDQWYHWQCVGILTEPKADSNWMCTRCKKKKQSLAMVAPKPVVAQKSLSTSPIVPLTKYEATGSQWQCPTCHMIVDNNKPSICCDDCDNWYHWHCVGISVAPDEDDSWFCHPCIEKQAKTLAIAYKLAKVRRL